MKVLTITGIVLLLWVIFAQSCLNFRVSDNKAKKEFAEKNIQLAVHTIKVNNYPVHYVQTGDDTLPTLVFVHGTPGSWNAFEKYLSDTELLKKFRLVSIDRPGFGYSNFGSPMHLKDQARTIAPLFAKIANQKPVYLVGHSLGGPLILKLAADMPDVFDGLVIISGSVDPGEEKPEKWRPYLFKSPLNVLVPGAFRPSNEELWYLKKDLVVLQPDFSKVRCPVYFIHGLQDTWVPPGNVEYARKLLINAPLIEELMIPDANHFIPWTKYQEIKTVLLQLGTGKLSKI